MYSKKVFLYSIQHTGTHFLRDIVLASGIENKRLNTDRLNDLRMRTKDKGVIHAFSRENYTPEQYLKIITDLFTPQQCKQAKLMLFFCHHVNPNSKMMETIKRTQPPIPYVIPIRDPLLAINTYMFWDHGYSISAEKRLHRVEIIVDRFISILDIPDKHAMLLPVDICKNESEEDRNRRVKELYNFCNLDWTEEVVQYLKKCNPAHQTQNISNKATKESQFSRNKKAILLKDTKFLMSNMQIEISFLQKQEKLKDKLIKLGYKDLVW